MVSVCYTYTMRTWLKPNTTKQMLPTEAAWLAGFFDGEGSLGVYNRRNRKGGKVFPSYVLSVPNTYKPALEKCKQLTTAGNVCNKPYTQENHKPQWVWRVYSQRNVIDVLTQLLPYLVIKREKAEEMLAGWSDIQVDS
jgi:hypothetical protein